MQNTAMQAQQPKSLIASLVNPFGSNIPAGSGGIVDQTNKQLPLPQSTLINRLADNIKLGGVLLKGAIKPQKTQQVEEEKKRESLPAIPPQQLRPQRAPVQLGKQSFSKIFRQGQPIQTVEKPVYSKKRDLEEFDSEYIMRPAPLVNIIETDEDDAQYPLPSPIYKSDFNILADEQMQYVEPEQKPQVVIHPVDTQPVDVTLYIPHSIQEKPKSKVPSQAFDEFERYLQSEHDLNGLKSMIEGIEHQEQTLNEAIINFKQAESELKKDTRSQVILPQTQFANQNCFFEFHPHLIYSEPLPQQPQSLPALQSIVQDDSQNSGYISKDLAYSVNNQKIIFWKPATPHLPKVTLSFTTYVLGVCMLSTNKHLLISTIEEFHVYEIKTEQDGKFSLIKQSELSTDRTCYGCLVQLQNKRIFVAGEKGKISELTIEGVSNVQPNQAKKMVVKVIATYIKDSLVKGAKKIMGIKNNNQKKMLKRDHEAEKETTKQIISKFFGSFFSTKDPLASKVVTDLIEDSQANLLFSAVSDSENPSCIEIFDISKNGFSLIKRITLEDLAPLIKQRTGIQDFTVSIEISKLHYSSNELTIVLINGHMITIKLTFTDQKPTIPKETPKKVCEHSLIQCFTPQFEQFLEKYDCLFDDEYLPDNISEQVIWKPLPAKPIYMYQQFKFKDQSFGLRVVESKFQQDGKIVILIEQKLAANMDRYFLIYFSPNFRRGRLNKYTQYLVGVSEIHQGSVSLGIQLSLAENQKNTKVTVLTDAGQCNFMIPENEDFMYQYLQMLIFAKDDIFTQRVQSDFDIYLKSQDLEVSLEALMKIALAYDQKLEKTANFVVSNFTALFYQNQNIIMSAPQTTSRFMIQSNFDSQKTLRNSLLSVVKYVNNHLTKFGQFKEVAVTNDIASLAGRYFLDFSQTANQLVSSPILDSIHLHAYPHLLATPMVYESLRFPLFYHYLNFTLKPILQEKVYKVKDQTKVERGLSIREASLALMRINQLFRFLQNYQTQLGIVSVEQDFFAGVTPFTEDEVPKNLKSEIQQVIHLTLRCFESISIIVNAGFSEPSIKGVQTKELAKSLSSLKVEQVVFEGIQKNVDVCNFVEHIINFNEGRIVQEIGNMRSFIGAEAFSIFVGKKYLAGALALKGKKGLDEGERMALDQMKQQGYRELMAFPLRVNLVTALEHLIQLDMILESTNLCLKCIDLVDDIKSINTTRGGDSLIERVYAERLPQQKSAITHLIAILREIITRIQTLEGQKPTLVTLQDQYLQKLRVRLEDSALTADYLKDLKWKLLRLAASTKSDLFQIELCDLLYKCNQLQDLKFLKSSALSAPQMQTMIANLAKQQLPSPQETLLKGKLEALYSHYVQAKSWSEAFLTIMDQVCFSQQADSSKFEINERFIWLQKAEGCLIKYQQQMQTDDEGIPQETITKMLMFKDYFLLLIQLKDIAQERQTKYKLSQDFIDKLKFQIVQPDDLCLMALELHQWVHFLTIIEINELRDYEGAPTRRLRKNVNLQDTQQRIDFMYKNIISRRPLETLQSSPKKLKNLKKWLKQLHTYAKNQAWTENSIEMFNKDLIIKLLEAQSQEYFSKTRKGLIQGGQPSWDTWWNKSCDKDQWTPFWYLDFFIDEIGCTAQSIYSIVQKKGSDALLSQTYVLSKWLSGNSKEVKQIVFIVDKLGEEISDEMLYPKTYVENMRAVITKVQKQIESGPIIRQNSSSANMMPQQ